MASEEVSFFSVEYFDNMECLIIIFLTCENCINSSLYISDNTSQALWGVLFKDLILYSRCPLMHNQENEMIKESKNLNYPSISVSAAVDTLSELYSNAVTSGMSLKLIPTPFFWGPAGIGKSEAVYLLAERIRKKTSKTVAVTDVRLLLFSPVDLRGVPVADADRKFTNWLMPQIFNMDLDEDHLNILFLDELSAAPQSVQAAAYQICLDRRVGEHMLPANCIVIAAGNRTTDQSVSYKMPKALCNRLMHFDFRVDFDSWRSWAVQHDIDSRIIGYLSFDNSRLCAEPDASDLAYPTPRSWSFVSNILKAMDCAPDKLHQLISACIGNDAAIEFEAWCSVYQNLPSVQDIFCGRCHEYPKTHDVLYALISSITAAVRTRREDITQQELENVCAYAKRFPEDFAMSFFNDISSVDELKTKLMQSPSMQEWLVKHHRRI